MTSTTGRPEAQEPQHPHGQGHGQEPGQAQGQSHGHGHGHGREALSADTVHDQAFWEERYRSQDALWSGRPNPQLVAEASGLAPGTALDVGCGEGADAVWLAERGWRVVATDISTVALERAAAHARTLGPEIAERISWQQADITADALPSVLEPGAYDLVSSQFMHLPKDQRLVLQRRLGEATAPGGVLLVVGHHPSDLDGALPRPMESDWFYTAEEVTRVLPPEAGWSVLVDDTRARTVPHPEGGTVTIHDAVFTARRQAPGAG
jgi:SAM-dependent methyltransferase